MADQYQPSTDSVLTETRPRTLLSPVSGQSLREQVGHRRTISAANSTAQRANYEASQPFGSRSPSIIPEPMPSANNIPVGDSRLEPQPIDIPIQPHPTHLGLHPPLKPSKQPSQSSAYQVQVITELEPPRLEKDEYIVSLPLPSRVQDQYSRTVRYYQKSIQNILQAEIPEKSSMADTVKLLARLENISTHIDLENDTALSQSDVPLAEEANWAASCSAKFQFLRTLLNMMRHHDDSRVVVVAREGQLLDILERFLKAISVAFERLDSRDVMITEPNVRVILLPSGRLEGRITVFVDLIIAFDSSFDRYDTQVAAMRRRHPLKPDRACPIVYLLVYSSADHIQRCVPEMKSAMDKHKTVINCIVQTKSRVGVLEPGESRPDAAAEEVAAFVEAGGTEKNWTLPRIQVIKLQGLELMSASQSTGGYRPVENTSPIWRHRDTDSIEEDGTSKKRKRMSPIHDIAHFGDSVPDLQASQISELRAALNEAETALADALAANATLSDSFTKKELLLQDHSSALDDLQTRFEKRNTAYHLLRHENNKIMEDAALAVEAADRKQETLTNKITSMKELQQKLEAELKETRGKLAGSSVPEIAEMEKLRSENRELAQAKAALERKVQSITEDFNFTREQYQLASTAAAEASPRIADLEREVASLRIKASGETAKLRQTNERHEIEQHRASVEKASAEIEDLKEQLRRKERGRGMATRTGSTAPRSPRLGAAQSPARSRANSKAPGSRPGSPIRSSFLGPRKARGLME